MSSDAMSNPKHPFVVTFVKLVKDTSAAHLGARDERLVAHKLGSVGSEIPAASVMFSNYSRGRHRTLLCTLSFELRLQV